MIEFITGEMSGVSSVPQAFAASGGVGCVAVEKL